MCPEVDEIRICEGTKEDLKVVTEGAIGDWIAYSKGKPYCAIKQPKYEVGKTYSVQPKRTEPTVWYCPECHITQFDETNGKRLCSHFGHIAKKKLKIVITNRSVERLLDIDEKGSKSEGFSSKMEFTEYVYRLYGKMKGHPTIISYALAGEEHWNPYVWRYTFTVMR